MKSDILTASGGEITPQKLFSTLHHFQERYNKYSFESPDFILSDQEIHSLNQLLGFDWIRRGTLVLCGDTIRHPYTFSYVFAKDIDKLDVDVCVQIYELLKGHLSDQVSSLDLLRRSISSHITRMLAKIKNP